VGFHAVRGAGQFAFIVTVLFTGAINGSPFRLVNMGGEQGNFRRSGRRGLAGAS